MNKKVKAKNLSSVKTSLEFDVKETITKRVEEAINEEVNKCSKDFHRNLDVLFTVVMD